MFLLKKIIGALLQPVPVALLLLIAAAVMLWRSERRERRLRTLLISGTLLLLVLSLRPVPYLLVGMLENVYPPYQSAAGAATPSFIVVLGGGSIDDHTLPPASRLEPQALGRIVEGVRLARLHPEARLLVSGGRLFSSMAEADVMAAVAADFGIERGRIVKENRSLDTHDQAVLIRDMIGAEPFLLITSAVHMPRSVALFRRQGLDPVPAPTAYLYGRDFYVGPRTFIPSAEHLRNVEFTLHELYGLAWAWMRRQL